MYNVRISFSGLTAACMLILIDGAGTWVKKSAIRAYAEGRARMLAMQDEARGRLHRLVHEHGIRHG